jgi:hypothetical protein
LRKRVLVLIAGIAAFAATVSPTAGSAPSTSDVSGPACADVVQNNATATSAGFYDATGVHFRVALAAPSCKYVTYTLYVLDASGTTQLDSTSIQGNGTDDTLFLDAAGSGASVCVYLTTSVGNHVFDRAPDSGCGVLALDGGIGATGYF